MVIDQLRGGPAFATREQRQTKESSLKEIIKENNENKLALDNKMKKVTQFSGKRFLGLTPAGKPVWAAFNIDKNELKPNIKFSHKLSVLTKEGAAFANDRYMFRRHESVSSHMLSQMTRKLSKKRGGEVTLKTLHWLKRLQNLEEIEYSQAFIKGKTTSYFFMNVMDAIYIGNEDINKHMILEYWKFPSLKNESNYFLIEGTWKYPDDLNS
jgi:hypothetical protein